MAWPKTSPDDGQAGPYRTRPARYTRGRLHGRITTTSQRLYVRWNDQLLARSATFRANRLNGSGSTAGRRTNKKRINNRGSHDLYDRQLDLTIERIGIQSQFAPARTDSTRPLLATMVQQAVGLHNGFSAFRSASKRPCRRPQLLAQQPIFPREVGMTAAASVGGVAQADDGAR